MLIVILIQESPFCFNNRLYPQGSILKPTTSDPRNKLDDMSVSSLNTSLRLLASIGLPI
jgi:hypothetical protein